MAETSTLSIRPSTFSVGGGLLDDADVTIKTARWVVWDYQGKSKAVLALHVAYEDEEGKVHDQYYSAGDLDAFNPANGGKGLHKVGKRDSLSGNSNFAQFINSYVNASGLDETEALPDGVDPSFLDGTQVHVKREQQPDRPGIQKDPANIRDRTVLCIQKILARPGDKKAGATAKGKAAAGSKANGKAAAAGAGAGTTTTAPGPLDEQATDAVLGVLAKAEGPIPKTRLSQLLFAELKGTPECSAVIQYAFKDAFLGAEGKPWVFDGTNVSMPA